MPDLTDVTLSEPIVRIGICVFMDVLGDPLRYGLAPVGPIVIAPGFTGDAHFDNHTFTTLDPTMISVEGVSHSAGGSGSVTLTLSATLELDSDILNDFADPTKFRGRVVKLWLVRFDENWAVTHARRYYRGVMGHPEILISPSSGDDDAHQVITVTAENYQALLASGSPDRTLLWTPDPADLAAQATIGSKPSAAALGLDYISRNAFNNPDGNYEQYR